MPEKDTAANMATQKFAGDLAPSSSSKGKMFGHSTTKYRFGQTNTLGPQIGAAAQNVEKALANNEASVKDQEQAQLRSKMRQQAEDKQRLVTTVEARKLEIQKRHLKLYETLTTTVQEELRKEFSQELKAEVWAKADDVKREMREQLVKDLTSEVKEELRKKLGAEIQRGLPAIHAEEVAIYRTQFKQRVEKQYRPLVEAELRGKLEPEISKELRTKLEVEVTEKLRTKLEPEITKELTTKLKPEIMEMLRYELEPDLIDGIRMEQRDKLAREEQERPRLKSDENEEKLFVTESDFSDEEGGDAQERQRREESYERRLEEEFYSNRPQLDEEVDDESPGYAHAGTERSRPANTPHDNHYSDRDEARFDERYELDSNDEERSIRVRPKLDAYHGKKRSRLTDDEGGISGYNTQATGEYHGGAITQIPGESPVKPVNDSMRQAAKRTRHELDSEDEEYDYGMSKRLSQHYPGGAFTEDSDALDNDSQVKEESLSETNEKVVEKDFPEDHGVKWSETYPPSPTDDCSGASEQEYDESDESGEEQEYDESDEGEDENVGIKVSETYFTSGAGDLRGSSKDNAIDLSDSESDGETQLAPSAYNHTSEVIQNGSATHGENLALTEAAYAYAQQAPEDEEEEGDEDEETLVEDIGVTTVVTATKQGEEVDVAGFTAVVKTIEQEEEL